VVARRRTTGAAEQIQQPWPGAHRVWRRPGAELSPRRKKPGTLPTSGSSNQAEAGADDQDHDHPRP
jgi:hypothetical protein